MEISNELWLCLQFVDSVYGVEGGGRSGRYSVEGLAIRIVSVVGLRTTGKSGTLQRFVFFVKPTSQNCFSCDAHICIVGVLDVHFFAIKNCDVACCGKFGGAEKGVAGDGGDDVNVFCWLLDVVMQLVDIAGWCSRSVG